MKALRELADNRETGSFATKLRRKRFALFVDLISSLPRPIRILDVGGTPMFWETMNFTEEQGVEIVLLNLWKPETALDNFISVIGDARSMRSFAEREFDVVFSNSVIEHVGTYEDQRCMAEEVMRVGKRYFLQTPNRYFPIEPHFLVPLFQFLPVSVRVLLIRHFDLGWFHKIPDKRQATGLIRSIRLLTRWELVDLFPGATIYKEKFLGLTKSLIAYGGWEKSSLNRM